MYFYPDNFLYFLILFTVSIACGTYLLFAYYVNRLLLANALVLFLAAARVAVDYYLPTISTYKKLVVFSSFHGYGVFVSFLVVLQWLSIWYYVRPLKGLKWEKIGNLFYTYGFVIIPLVVSGYFTYIGKIFYFSPVKINGYWQFNIAKEFWSYNISNYHLKIGIAIISITLLVGIIRDKKNRLRQFLLFVSFVISPVLYAKFYVVDGWNIPNSGGIHVIHNLIVSWYLSNYRLFKSNINLITKDLFNSISDLTISTNPSLQIINFNEKAQNFFDIKLNRIEVFFDTYLIDDINKIKNILANKQGSLEVVLKDKHGAKKIMNLKLAPFKNGNEIYGYTFLFTDLTELKAKEAELQKLNKTKDQLFAIIGHDLRKPALEFRGIQNKVNYLIKKDDYGMLQKLGASLEKSALSLNNLLDNLLNWAGQQQGFIKNTKQNIPVQQVVYTLFEFFENVALNKNIELVNNTTPNTTVFVDANAFSTILRNIIDNAIKFTLPGGKITVSEIIEADQVTIMIQDTGIGMEADVLKNMFKEQHVKRTKGTTGEVGTGLGLGLIKEFVKANNGVLKVESKPNVGSEFFVVFKTKNKKKFNI